MAPVCTDKNSVDLRGALRFPLALCVAIRFAPPPALREESRFAPLICAHARQYREEEGFCLQREHFLGPMCGCVLWDKGVEYRMDISSKIKRDL